MDHLTPIATLALVALAAPAMAQTASATPAAATATAVNPAIRAAVDDPARPEAERARDQYRHPAETLAFFGLKPDMTVVEIAPGAGWYTNILAPVLAAKGQYVGVLTVAPRAEKRNAELKARIAAEPDRYGKARFVAMTADGSWADGLDADLVLTFRNAHDFAKNAEVVFGAFFRALKPGGVLGIVDHRLPEDRTTPTDSYIKESDVIRFATDAGFRLDARSEINANPKDTADYPKGVFALPPTLTHGDTDREKYLAIGESDRMTLRFVKPAL